MKELYSQDSERAVLGSLLTAYQETQLKIQDFYFTENKHVFAAIDKLKYDTDMLSVRDELVKAGHLQDVGAEVYISELITYADFQFTAHQGILQELSIRRAEILKRHREIAQLQDQTIALETIPGIDLTGIKADSSGIQTFLENAESIFDLYRNGYGETYSFGFPLLDTYVRARRGEMYVFNSSPKTGKTELLASFMLKLSQFKFGIFSPEAIPIKRYFSMLSRKMAGKPFFKIGDRFRIEEAEIYELMNRADSTYRFIDIEPNKRTIDCLLSKFKILVDDFGMQGMIIDPFNKIIQDDNTISEHHWIGKCLDKIEYFIKKNNLFCWIAVHPKKLVKEDGKYPVPTPYDISGSSYWYSKPDVLIALHRDVDATGTREDSLEIHVQAVRWSEVGQEGAAKLKFDRVTGRFSEALPDEHKQ